MNLTRREFLRITALSSATFLASCAAPTALAPTAPPAAATNTSAAKTAPTTVPQAVTPRTGGTVVIARGADGGSLDPATNFDGGAWEVMESMMEPLVRKKPRTAAELAAGASLGEVEPCLAESWKVSDDGLTWTFNLRKGVKFHDGTPLDADAVITNVDRLLNDKNPYFYKGTQSAGLAAYNGIVASYRAVDSNTVEFTLKRKNVFFLPNLTVPNAVIASPAAMKKYGQDLANNPVGTGPFKFAERLVGDHVTVERNPDWWNGKTYLDKATFRTIPDPSARLAVLHKGEIDFAESITVDDIADIQADPKLDLIRVTGGLNWVFLNTEKKPFDDVRVRQALNYAVNSAEIHQYLFKGMGSLANSPMPPFYHDYDANLKPYSYDPQKAKDLLTQAGYPNGFQCGLTTYSGSQQFNPAGGQKLSEAIQQDLAKVGVKVNIVMLDNANWVTKRASGDFDMLTQGWFGMNPGVEDGVMFPIFHSSNVGGRNGSRIKDPKLDKMIEDAQGEFDAAKRTALYKDMQKYVMDIAPMIFINIPDLLYAAKKTVKDIAFTYVFARSLYKTWISS